MQNISVFVQNAIKKTYIKSLEKKLKNLYNINIRKTKNLDYFLK